MLGFTLGRRSRRYVEDRSNKYGRDRTTRYKIGAAAASATEFRKVYTHKHTAVSI